MNVRAVFWVILKVIGIYTAFQFLEYAVQIFPLVEVWFDPEWDSWSMIATTVLSYVLVLIVYGAGTWILVFRTDWLVKRIVTEDRNVEVFFNFSVHRSTVLTIVLVVAGILILTEEIPYLLYLLKGYANSNAFLDFSKGFDERILISGIKVLLGVFLVFYNRLIIRWIEWRRRRSELKGSRVTEK